MTVFLLPAFLFLVTFLRATPAEGQLVRTGFTSIISASSGKCLDISGQSQQQEAAAIQWPCNFGGNQQWIAEPFQGSFILFEQQSGQCLSVYGASKAGGEAMVQEQCAGKPSQMWTMVPVGNSYQLKSTLSGMCMTTTSDNASDGSQMVQQSCSDSTLVTWIFKSGLIFPYQPIDLQANHSGQCLTVAGSNSLAQNPCTGGVGEQWFAYPYGVGYQLVSKAVGLCLDKVSTNAAAPLLNTCTTNPGGDFYLWPNGSGSYFFLSGTTWQCLGVTNSSMAAGAPLSQAACDLTGHQLWSVSLANTPSSWSPVIPLNADPIAVANLPNGQLLTWSANDPYSFQGDVGGASTITFYSLFDMLTETSGAAQVSMAGSDMFCPGIANLADGRILVNGGDSSPKTTLFDPATMSWKADALMNIPRGYQGDVTLSTGSVLTMGGSWSGSQSGGKNGEIWASGAGWSVLSNLPEQPVYGPDPQGVYRGDNHLWLFATSNGQVFHAGPSAQMNWITTTGTGSITSMGNRADDPYSINGNAVMYDVNKIMKAGGAPAYQNTNATNTAYLLDISNGSAGIKTTKIAPMTYPRAFSSGVVLPSGQVMIVGGQTYPVPFTDSGAILIPELWDPLTGAFKQLAPMQTPRTYHSTAILMQDARVFVGGGGQCGSGCSANHFNAEVLTPPYLLNADGSLATRPAITASPATVVAGNTISVTTNSPVVSFALIRSSSITHSLNNDQRRIPLTSQGNNGLTYTLAIPSDHGVALPGYYMLFAINAQDVPSVAASILIK